MNVGDPRATCCGRAAPRGRVTEATRQQERRPLRIAWSFSGKENRGTSDRMSDDSSDAAKPARLDPARRRRPAGTRA